MFDVIIIVILYHCYYPSHIHTHIHLLLKLALFTKIIINWQRVVWNQGDDDWNVEVLTWLLTEV